MTNLKNKPVITIITVVLNNKKKIDKALKSIFKQSYKNIELIVIDGGSTDGTINIIKKYHKKINYWISEKDDGIYDAINKGIKKSTGDIIGILHSDDYLYKDGISIVAKYFKNNPKIDFLFGSVKKYKLLYGYRPWKIFFSFGFYSTHSVGFFIKRTSQIKLGYYNTKYKYSSDYDLFYRMIVNKKMLGMATKKEEIIGVFSRGGVSSRLSFIDYLNETIKIRLDNGQNRLLVLFIFILKYLKNISKI
jgi:glycosyltransferase involved in cell wall biosynthesis